MSALIMAVPVVNQRREVLGDIFLNFLNSSTIEKSITKNIPKLIALATEYTDLKDFNTDMDAVLSALHFSSTIEGMEQPPYKAQHVTSASLTIRSEVAVLACAFRAYSYPTIFASWFEDNNAENYTDYRLRFEDSDLEIEYSNLYIAFIRLCAKLRNQSIRPDVVNSLPDYEASFLNCKLLLTRLKSLEMICDSKEKY